MKIGWHADTLKAGDCFAPIIEAPALVHQHALVGLYRPGDDGPDHVGNVYPDRTGENVMAMVEGKEYSVPWPMVAAMRNGRDFEMTEVEA